MATRKSEFLFSPQIVTFWLMKKLAQKSGRKTKNNFPKVCQKQKTEQKQQNHSTKSHEYSNNQKEISQICQKLKMRLKNPNLFQMFNVSLVLIYKY